VRRRLAARPRRDRRQASDQGNRTTPSYVAFIDSERLIWDAAKNQVDMNPINTVFGELTQTRPRLLPPFVVLNY
jgi:hypothetical protein